MAIVQGSNAFLPGEILRRKWRGKSAEVVVAENKPGATGPCKLETGNLEAVKDRTDEEPLTAWRTSKSIPRDRAGARVRAVTMGAESSRQPIRRIARRAGGARQQCRALGRSGMRRKAEVTVSGKEETPTLAGTARYGPVRRVVWDPWLTNTQSRGPDSASFFCSIVVRFVSCEKVRCVGRDYFRISAQIYVCPSENLLV